MGIRKGYARLRREQERGWKARMYVVGDACFKTARALARKYAFFYDETFEINAEPPAKLNFKMTVS